MRGPFPTENRSLISFQRFFAISMCVMVDRKVGSIVFNIHDTSMELTVHQSSSSEESSEGCFIEPSMNPYFFLARRAVLIALAHSS